MMPTLDELMLARDARIEELHRFEIGRTALLVIDMQHGFLDPGASLEVPQGRELVPQIQRLIRTCRAKNCPVIFTEFVYSTAIPCLRGDPFGREHLPAPENETTGLGLPSNNCLVGSPSGVGVESANTIEDLAPLPGELVIQGHTYDKFFGTPLDLALRSQDIRFLIVTGVVTDVCVNATLMSASARDYRVTAVTDGVATLWPELQEACFTIWKRKFARLRSTEEVITELNTMN